VSATACKDASRGFTTERAGFGTSSEEEHDEGALHLPALSPSTGKEKGVPERVSRVRTARRSGG